jgi:CDGSH-type Zn-finger protein
MATKKQSRNRTSNNRFKIKVSKNGPYVISGGIPLAKQIIGIDAAGYSYEWREGKKYPSKDNYALCRCGQSKNKQFSLE